MFVKAKWTNCPEGLISIRISTFIRSTSDWQSNSEALLNFILYVHDKGVLLNRVSLINDENVQEEGKGNMWLDRKKLPINDVSLICKSNDAVCSTSKNIGSLVEDVK